MFVLIQQLASPVRRAIYLRIKPVVKSTQDVFTTALDYVNLADHFTSEIVPTLIASPVEMVALLAHSLLVPHRPTVQPAKIHL
jgi:hypothetical protein